jgi:hypothetical protein
MVWGAIGKEYQSRVINVDVTLDAERSQDVLREDGIIDDIVARIALVEQQEFFYQDGAPAYQVESTKFCEDRNQQLKSKSLPFKFSCQKMWYCEKVRK